jgi:hypothetical protein
MPYYFCQKRSLLESNECKAIAFEKVFTLSTGTKMINPIAL